jgi:hypothetical protein
MGLKLPSNIAVPWDVGTANWLPSRFTPISSVYHPEHRPEGIVWLATSYFRPGPQELLDSAMPIVFRSPLLRSMLY